jgi:hypothetical protein
MEQEYLRICPACFGSLEWYVHVREEGKEQVIRGVKG